MINELQDLRAKNQAAYALLVEFLTNARASNDLKTIRKFLKYLLQGHRKKSFEAVDLNEVFQFVLFGEHLLVIPKPWVGDRDLLVLKNFQSRFDFEPELIEFEDGNFKADTNVFMPGYLRLCLQRGRKREFLQE